MTRRITGLLMLSIAAISGGQGNYYTRLARDDYYLKGGEPPGAWLGRGAQTLGLSGKVGEKEFKNLLAGLSPDGREGLVQNAGAKNRQAAWDLTFSAPKTVSVLWSQAPPEVRRQIEEAQAAAVKEALRYVEDAAAFTRRGRAGHDRERAGLVVATFEHGCSRDKDPQLHTLCLVLNVAARDDGTTGAITSKELYKAKMAAGALYRAELSYQLERRLGVIQKRPVHNDQERSWFEVSGVPQSLAREFSKRRQTIEEALQSYESPSAHAAAKVTLGTRGAKENVSRADLFSQWLERGRALGFTEEHVRALLGREPPRHDAAGRVNTAVQGAIQKLTEHQSHFSERELLRRAAEESQTKGLWAAVVRTTVSQTLQNSPEIVWLGRRDGEARYTTREMVALEEKLLAQADALRKTPSHAVSGETLEAAAAKVEKRLGHALSDEQKEAVRQVAQAPGSIQLMSGLAGTGKTTVLAAGRLAWEREGLAVVGAALSGKAAQGLEEGAGIRSTTIARLLGMPEKGYRGDLEKGPADDAKHHARMLARSALGKSTWKPAERVTLDEKTVLVIDEAGMVGTRRLQRLVEEAAKASARLVLVGDAKQLQPVEAGGPFASLARRHGAAELTEITRQREEWARDAVKKLARGEGGAALRAFAERGLLTVCDDRRQAMKALVSEWKKEGLGNPKDHLILTGTNLEAALLNRMAQKERSQSGELGGSALRVEGYEIRKNDRVLFTRNSQLLGVRNGHLGTVLGVDTKEQTLTVRLDTGKRVVIPVTDYGHVKLGYAVTTHKAQGATAEHAYALVGGPMQDRELSYVQASRARERTRLFTDRLEAGDDLKDLCRQVEKSRQKDLAHDIARSPEL